jgi:transcriptional regulator with XRE-family HTH domain
MAEATTTLPTANPKQVGKQLRAVRRRKGLSLSEVARGAGLSRRELVNYERGKVEIPESDLWVLAGSCGVDVAELVPASEPLALGAAPATIEDSITQLRSNQPDAGLSRHLDTLYALRALPQGSPVQLQERERAVMAEALGHDPDAIEAKLVDTMRVSKDEARRLRALIVPDAPRYTPLAIEAPEPEPVPEPFVPEAATALTSIPGSASAFDAELPTGNVDVFEELAKLPEPVALPEPGDHTDFLSTPPEPSFAEASDGAAEGAFAAWPSIRSALPEPTDDPILVDMQANTATPTTGTYGAEHAPPIDVVGRTDRFDFANGSDASSATLPVREAPLWEPAPPIWDSTWTTTDAAAGADGPTDIVEFVDDYVAEPADTAGTADTSDPESSPLWNTWNRADFVDEAVDLDEAVTEPAEEVIDEVEELVEAPCADVGPWDHEPDPAATSSGFYVDWGTDETTTEGAVFTTDAFTNDAAAIEPAATEEVGGPEAWAAPEPWSAEATTTTGADWSRTAETPTWLDAPTWVDEPISDDAPADDEPADDEPAPISWRPLADSVLAVVAIELATISQADPPEASSGPSPETAFDISFEPSFTAPVAAFEPEPKPEPEPEPVEPEPVEEFVTAGQEWELGNALPLVEVRGQGGLVMRRADERWALADVTTAPSFALEVDVDFRSGPGFGVLFHASTDAAGHMSGYSFDVDPIHEGGSYLVRQWQADRELWNPIARVAAPDPAGMHGVLALRVVVLGERLSASVNGSTVLEVDSLELACAERNRQPASGDRVGIQAWSSSDLEIETLRVAKR